MEHLPWNNVRLSGLYIFILSIASLSMNAQSYDLEYVEDGLWYDYVAPFEEFLDEDQYSEAIPLFFSFNFFGNTYTEVYINQNGFLTFDDPGLEDTYIPQFLPDTTGPNNLIAGIWHDIDASFCDPYYGGCITYETIGTAPDRRFVVSFFGSDFCYGYHDFQIKLYETTNIIEVHSFFFDGFCSEATMGIENEFGTEAIEVPGRNAADDWYVDYGEPVHRFTPAIDNDAGIFSNFTSYCSGPQDIKTIVQNFGSNDITSLTVNWTWNGVTQTPVILSPTLFVPGEQGVVTLGQQTLIQGVEDTLEVWTSMPNGVTDGNPSNDYEQSNISPGMQGVYTIGGAAPDFVTFGDVIAALQDTGVCDTVWMLVRPGTYTEQLEIGAFPGVGNDNSVVIFEAENGDSSSVTLQFESTQFDENFVLHFVNGHHTIWQNLTIKSLGTTYSRIIDFDFFSFDNIIQNCALINQPSTSSSLARATIYSGNGSFRNTIRNNLLQYGSYGFYHSDYAQVTEDWLIENNVFDQFRTYGMYFEYSGNIEINGNSFVSAQTSATGMYLRDFEASSEVSHNEVLLSNGNDGIVIVSNTPLVGDTMYLFNNNVNIAGSSSTSMGISVTGYQVNCANNSINITATTTSSRAIDFRANQSNVINNIFVNTGGGQGIYTSGSDLNINNNAYWVTGAIFGEYISTSNDIFSFEEWLDETPYDSLSYFADPFFTSATDLHTNNNQLNGKAIPLGYVATDFEGDDRDPLNPDIGSDEFIPTNDDVSADLFLSPVLGCDAMQDVVVVVSNNGGNVVTQLNVNWSLNGVSQSGLVFSQPLSPEGDTAHVNLGTLSFNEDLDTIVVWTSMPNGNTDSSPLNDSTSTIFRTSMNGVYSVGGVDPDFSDLQDAVLVMQEYGICGPVTIQLRDGTYNGQVTIDSIPGCGDSNPIVIESESGDSSAVVLEATGLNSSTNYLIQMFGVDHIRFRNLTFYTGDNSLYCGILDITGGVTFLTVEGCRFEGKLGSSFGDLVNISGPGNNRYSFVGNTFYGGAKGVVIIGSSSFDMDSTLVSINKFEEHLVRALDLIYHRNLQVLNNEIVDDEFNSSNMDGIQILNVHGSIVVANNRIGLSQGGDGLYMNSSNNFLGDTGQSWIYNNFIYTNSGRGMRLWNSVRAHVYFNNVNVVGNLPGHHALEIVAGDSIYVKNNILVTHSGLAIANTFTPAPYAEIDHNDLVTYSGNSLANWSATPYADLATWQTGTGFDLNSFSIDPQFLAEDDLHILESTLNGQATPIAGITTDIDGDPRDVSMPDIGADEIGVAADDIGVIALLPQMPFARGMQAIQAVIRNYGNNTLTSASISWEVNGVPQPTFNYAGSLPSLGQDTVTIDSIDFELGTEYNFVLWTSSPNANTDTNPVNDSLEVNGQYAAASGLLTIGGTDPDLDSISHAITAMTIGGILDSVEFVIRSGTYDVALAIPHNEFLNCETSVVFRSESGDPADVTLVNTSHSDYTLHLNGADGVGFEDLTIRTVQAPYHAVLVDNEASCNSFVRCVFEGVIINTTASTRAVVFSGSSADTANTFINNTFRNGSYNLYWSGSNSQGAIFRNNIFEDAYFRAAYINEHLGLRFEENLITTTSSNSSYQGVFINNSGPGLRVVGNSILLPGRNSSALQISYAYGTPNDRQLIANNYLRTGNTSNINAMYLTYSTYTDVFYNTIKLEGTGAASNAFAEFAFGNTYLSVRNNIFYCESAGRAMYFNSSLGSDTLDQNDIFTAGPNLVRLGSTEYADLSSWQLASGQSANSVSEDPQFEDASSYSPTNAALNGTAYPVARIQTDIEGQPRDVTDPDIGCDEFNLFTDDVGLLAINYPVKPFPSGLNTVFIKFVNNGDDTLTTMQVDWEVNGVSQPTYFWSGLLPSAGTYDSLDIGQYDFMPYESYDIKVWVSAPNGMTDGLASNDTLMIEDTSPGLLGEYTIGGFEPDFDSLSQAVTALSLGGAAGPVTFNIREGVYLETMEINEFPGSSCDNPVIFQSETGDSSDVEINNLGIDATVVTINGADGLIFRNLTLRSVNPAYRKVIDYSGEAHCLEFFNNELRGYDVGNSSSSQYAVVYSNTSQDTGTVFRNNFVHNGSYGFYVIGSGAANSVFENNIVADVYWRGMRLNGESGAKVVGNHISMGSNTSASGVGIEIFNSDNAIVVLNNKVDMEVGFYGISLQNCEASSGVHGLMANNMASVGGVGSAYPFVVQDCRYQDIVFNSGHTYSNTASTTNNSALYIDDSDEITVLNNVMHSSSPGYAVAYINITNLTSDHNNYSTTGPNVGYFNSSAYTDLAAFQAASSTDGNSISSNPLFMSDSDLHVSNVLLNSAGQPFADVTTDFDHEIRDSIPDIGADEFVPPASDDAGIMSYQGPFAPFAEGFQPVGLILKNFGGNTLTSATVRWVVNGVEQAPFNWTGSLSPGGCDTLSIGSYDFAPYSEHDIVMWSELPNGVPDSTKVNDTLKVNDVFPALIGTYTVGGVLPDFVLLTQLERALNLGGTLGPVQFNLRAGVYDEQISISDFPRISHTDAVLFRSESGDKDDVILTRTFNGSNYIFELDGATYIYFEDLSFENTEGICLVLTEGAANITIDRCRFEARFDNSSTLHSCVFSGSSTESNVSVDSCDFVNGSYGIYMTASSGNPESGNSIRNSTFSQQRVKGVYITHQKGIVIEGNTVSSNLSYITGIELQRCDSTYVVSGNSVVLNNGGQGLRMINCDADPVARGIMANNFVEINGSSSTSYGFYGFSLENLDFYYNTLRINPSASPSSVPFETASSSTGDIEVLNCIFANLSGNYAVRNNWFIGSNCSMDHCDLYSVGTPLVYWFNDYTDLAALQGATAQNSFSTDADPIFVEDHGYAVAQAALDGGGDVIGAVSDDIEGDARNISTPDIGVDEFDLPAADLAILDIISPATFCGLSDSEPVILRIQNRGTVPQSGFDVAYAFDGGGWNSENVGAVVQPGEVYDHTFTGSLDLSTTGTYMFDAYVDLASDSNSDNDTLVGRVVEHFPALTEPVSNMIPLDGEIDLDKTVSFSWAPAPNASAYDVYIWPVGESEPASPQISDLLQINTLYSNLEYGESYNWKVVAENTCEIMLAGPVQTFTIRSLPDLVIDTVISPPSAFSGQIVEFEWQVNNSGDGNSLGTLWSDAVYLSTDATLNTSFDTYLGAVQNLTALDTGETYSQTGAFTIPDGFTGNYYIFVYTDRWNSLIEDNNSNNWERTSEPMAITLTPAPDLVVTSVSTPTTVLSGESIAVNYTVRNNGSGAVPPGIEWSDRLVFGDDPLNPIGFNLSFTDVSIELEPDSTYTIMTSATVPEAISGTYYMHAVTDYQNEVYEFSAEGNNSNGSLPITVILSPPPDLVVTDVSLDDTVSNRQRLTMEWIVANQGGGDAVEDYWQDAVYLSQSPVYNTNFLIGLTSRYQYEEVPSLGMYAATMEVVIPANITGEYYVYVVTDKRNDVFEFTYEDNNVYRSPEPIFIANPDLEPVDLIASDSVLAESTTAVSWQRVNNGPGTIYFTPTFSYIYLSSDEMLDEDDERIYLEYVYYTQTDKGDSIPVAANVSIPPQYNGDYYLILFEDATNTIFEDSVESNNIVARPIHISPGPSPDFITIDLNTPDTALAGAFVDFDFTTVNGGTEAVTTNWIDKVFMSFQPTWDPEFAIELNQVSQSADLDPGDTLKTILTSLLDLYTQENIYYFYVLSDYNEQVYEGFLGEMNNVFRSNPVYVKAVKPVDLGVETLTSPTSSFASGMPAQFDWVTKNNSTDPTTTNIWSDRLFLSLDTVWSVNDIPLGTAASAGGTVLPGAVRSNTISITLPNGVSGQYYVIVRADIDNVSLDQDTTNNVNTIRDGAGVPQPIDIILSPSPDLVVTSWNTPATAIAGQPMVIQYSVNNQGSAQAAGWVDKIYISEDNTISSDDVQFYVSGSQSLLAADSLRRDTVSSDVLSTLIGNYIVILQTDAQDDLYEHNGEENNLLTRSIEIVAPPPSDLSVSSVFHPVSVIAGENIDITWVTQNTGTFPATGTYREVVYISPDTTWSPDDRIFGVRDDIIYLPPGGTENVSLTSNVTGVATGDYYALVQTDARQNILESDETNNFGYSEVPMNVDVKSLIIDSLTFDSLTNFTELYYKLEITPDIEGETIIIDLEGDSINGINQLYARFGQMPTLADFDFSYDNPLTSDQQVLLPSVEVGTYYILVYGLSITAEQQEVSLLARVVDYEILSATPNNGVRNTQVTVRIRGTKLNGTQQVRLRRSFPWFSLNASEVLEVNDNLIYATFDLTGIEVDTYALDLIKADNSLAFIDDFIVTDQGQLADVQLNSELPSSVPPRAVPVKVVLTYVNNGGADAVDPVAEIEAPFGNVIAFTLEDLLMDNGQAILEVPLIEENGPSGILRPGATGRIELFAWSTPVAVFAIGLK